MMATTRESNESNASEALTCPTSLWPALSTLIGQPWPPVSEAGIAAFVRGAEDHRLLPIAAGDASLPASLRVRIAERYAQIADAQAQGDRDADDLLARLPGLLSGQWLGVSGVDFRRRIYPAARLRPMNDIDLLVRAEDTRSDRAAARGARIHRETTRAGKQ